MTINRTAEHEQLAVVCRSSDTPEQGEANLYNG
jgi:hypothetical protein